MVWSSHSVVAASSNSFYDNQAFYCRSVKECELSLAIYVEGKIFQGSHVPTKIFHLELYYHLSNNFQTTVYTNIEIYH